jgi:ABC-2 type transport system ATP-binding protein
MDHIMRVSRLKKNYGEVEAVRGVDFAIPRGSCFGLLGPNGAGKTTTIEMMEGILSPTEGAVYFNEEPIGEKFREKVGIQFQSTALPEFITVKETLEMFSSFYPEPRPMDELIQICSLEDIIDRDNRKLSGGQRQRMLLALAIIPKPDMVFLDEPTTGLDPQARRNFWELIERIKNEKATILLTTHYMDEAQKLCDQIAIMDKGQVLELDTPQGLIEKHFEGAIVSIPKNGHMDKLPKDAEIRGDHIELVTSNLDSTMKDLLSAGVNLEGLNIHKPNLEDLFIKLTGSSLRT